jgi:hypothetical protein
MGVWEQILYLPDNKIISRRRRREEGEKKERRRREEGEKKERRRREEGKKKERRRRKNSFTYTITGSQKDK